MAVTDKVKLQVKMGESTGLNTVLEEPGQLLFTTDDGLLHIDTVNGAGRKAVNAYADRLNNEITSTYISGAEINGKVITLTYGDGTTAATLTTQDTNTQYYSGNGTTIGSDNKINVDTANGITITNDKVSLDTSGATAGTYGEAAAKSLTHSGTFKIPKVTVDNYGRVTSISDITLTMPSDNDTKYTAGNGLIFNASNNKQFDVNPGTGITITDDKVALATSGVTAGSYGPASAASPAHGGTFTVPKITVDAYGRVTGSSDITITLPSDNDTKYYSGNGTTIGSGNKINVDTANGITITDDKVSLAASGVTAGSYGSASNQTPAYKGTFKIPYVTVDTYGRVTGASDVTVTLPAVTASDLGLANALHFLGTTTSTIADGGTQSVVVNSVTYVAGTPSSGQKKLVAGDVVLLTNTGKEFLWSGSAWEELGDESSHVIKGFTTVKGDGTVLTGSGKVGEDATITISHTTTGTNAKTLAAQTVTKADDGSYTFKIPNIAVDTYGHVKYTADSTITIETVAWSTF